MEESEEEEKHELFIKEEYTPTSEDVAADDTVISLTQEGETPGATVAASGNLHDGTMSTIHGLAIADSSSRQDEDDSNRAKTDGEGAENDDDNKDKERPRVPNLRKATEEGAHIVAMEDGLVAVKEDNIKEEDCDENNLGMNDVMTTDIKPLDDQDENANDAAISMDMYDDSDELSVLKLVEEGLRQLQRKNGIDPSVLYVITRAMHQVLVDDLGYTPAEVECMRPDVAVVLVAKGLKRPNLESLPSRFYRDAEPDSATEENPVDKSIKGAVFYVTHRIHKGVASSLASRNGKKMMTIIFSSLGVALSFMVASNHGNKKSPGESVQTCEFQFMSDVSKCNPHIVLSGVKEFDEEDDKTPVPDLQPGDLDKTWLDKLISFMSRPFGA
ncbi:hypothetical protein ACHAXA_005747 [Cyclostephanos tholiformis]|uniref:Uncharacterized protein n=1 Tax=Cyclostephanos tholiformis TaxID=382380 RepID=A0ABD3RSH8_9STRA